MRKDTHNHYMSRVMRNLTFGIYAKTNAHISFAVTTF